MFHPYASNLLCRARSLANLIVYGTSAMVWFNLFIVSQGISIPNKFDMSRPEDKMKLFSVM
jgi:hypothetical protein